MELLRKTLKWTRNRRSTGAPARSLGLLTAGIALFTVGCQQTPSPSAKGGTAPIFSTENRGPFYITGELEVPPPPPSPTPHPRVPPEAEEELRADREALQAETQRIKHAIGREIMQVAREQLPSPAADDVPSVAVIREINFDGWPKEIVEAVMAKYGMRIEERFVTQFSRNTFVGHATVASDHYYSVSGNPKPGIYKVFELSPRAVAKMAALEDEELRRRGMNPEKSYVRKVVFGVKKVSDDLYDLGVNELDAHPLP